MIEDQINDVKSQVTNLNAGLEQTRAQMKEMQRATLPEPVAPPPAPRTNSSKPPSPSVPSKPIANRPLPSPDKPDLHGLVMRELKDILERRRKYMDS